MALDFLDDALATLEGDHLLRRLSPVTGKPGRHLKVRDRTCINFCSNDYLGLASDPRLAIAASQAAEREGVGAGAARLVTGDLEAHRRLEAALAGLSGAEAALLFNSGYHANLGTIPALVGPGDVVFSDALNHASLIDGCRLSRAEVVVYRHGNVDDLAAKLEAARGRFRRRLVVTDAIFSMDGDLAPLPALCELSRTHDAILMVDEAHAVGVFGELGGGLCEQLGVIDGVDVRMGTLGKALGAFGAFVAGESRLRAWLSNRARTFVFTTALPPPVCAAAEAAVALVEGDAAGLRARLWQNVARLNEGLATLGLVAPGAASQILPIVIGDAARTMAASQALFERGVFVQGIRPPTVPPDGARLRLTVMATHTPEDVDQALEAIDEVLVRGR
jgi:8-amino-7-oxononanoate synthase